jgi:Leu/Phe-tRNA-protein transferase
MNEYLRSFLYGIALGTIFIAFTGAFLNIREVGSTIALIALATILIISVLIIDRRANKND